MSVELNHTIVSAATRQVSATFLAESSGLPAPRRFGPFLAVEVTTASPSTSRDRDARSSRSTTRSWSPRTTSTRSSAASGSAGWTYWADPSTQPRGRDQPQRRRPRRLLRGSRRPLPGDHHPPLRQRRVSDAACRRQHHIRALPARPGSTTSGLCRPGRSTACSSSMMRLKRVRKGWSDPYRRRDTPILIIHRNRRSCMFSVQRARKGDHNRSQQPKIPRARSRRRGRERPTRRTSLTARAQISRNIWERIKRAPITHRFITKFSRIAFETRDEATRMRPCLERPVIAPREGGAACSPRARTTRQTGVLLFLPTLRPVRGIHHDLTAAPPGSPSSARSSAR